MNHRLEHRVARLERLAQVRPRPVSAAELLARETEDTLRLDWWSDANPLISPALGCSPDLTFYELAAIGRQVGATARLVARAVLRHLEEWAALDEAGRAQAVTAEWRLEFEADLERVAAAVEAHGAPVSAPELSPPLTWPWAGINHRLRALVAVGWLAETGEVRASWPVYAWPAAGDGAAEPHAERAEAEASQ